jgi:hypothetical protein
MFAKVLAAALALALPSTALAQACEMKGQNGMVTLVLCPAGLSPEAIAEEGKRICGDTMPCGAWVWTDAADVPAEAPDSHEKLTQAQITSAVAVWMNETGQLVVLEKVEAGSE